MTLSNFYNNTLSAVLVISLCICQEIIGPSLFSQNGVLRFSLTTNIDSPQQDQYLIAQLLDCNYQPEFRYYHSIGQGVILSLEIGKNEKKFQSIINQDDYQNQTLLINLNYNSLTTSLNVEIIQVQNNQKIMKLEHQEILKFNILQIGGQDEGLSKYKGIIQLDRLEFQSEQVITFINIRLKVNQNEFQHIVLNNTQNDFIVSNNIHGSYNKIAFYGNSYDEQQELNLYFDNYQHIIITNLLLRNEMCKLLIDSQSKKDISFIVQNSTFRGQFQDLIINFGYLEINNVDFINITGLQFIFQDQTTSLTIKIINTRFRNCSFSQSDLFPQIQSGHIIFYDVEFTKCSFSNRSFIIQPYPGFLRLFMQSIIIEQSKFDLVFMFKNIAEVEVVNFTLQKSFIFKTQIFSGNSQLMIKDFKIFDNFFFQSYLIMIFVSKEDQIKQQFQIDGLSIRNNTIKVYQPHLIAVTGNEDCVILNLIYSQNKLNNHNYFIFIILANRVKIQDIKIEKISLQTEFNIISSTKLYLRDIIINGVNINHNSFIVLKAVEVKFQNITISNIQINDNQLFNFIESGYMNILIYDVFIQDVNYNFSNQSIKSNIAFFRLKSQEITFTNISLNNITYFIGLEEHKQSYLIFNLDSNYLALQMKNISIKNIQSYYIEQFSGIIQLNTPIIRIKAFHLRISQSRLFNLKNNSTALQNFIGLFNVKQIFITQCNFSNIIGTQLFQVLSIFSIVFLNKQPQVIITVQLNWIQLSLNLIVMQIKSFQNRFNVHKGVCLFYLTPFRYKIKQVFQTQKYLIYNFFSFQVILINVKLIQAMLLLQITDNIFSNIVELECNIITIQNFSFQGNSEGSIMSLKSFRVLNLLQLHVINSVFYESSILQIRTYYEKSLIIIRNIEIINSEMVLQDIYPQRILQQIHDQYLIEIINLNSDMKIFIENSKLINNICSLCYKGLINIFNNNTLSKLVIQLSLFQQNKGSMQSILLISNFQFFQLRSVVFYNNTYGDQSLISYINTNISIFQCYIFNDRIQQNLNDRSNYNIQFSFFFGQYYQQNSLKYNHDQPRIISQSGVPLYLRLFHNKAQFKISVRYEQSVLVEQVIVNKFSIHGDEAFQYFILLPSDNKYPYQYFDPYQQIYLNYDLNYTIKIIDSQGDILYDQYAQQLRIQQYLYNLTQKAQILLLDEQTLDFDQQKQGFNLQKWKIKFNPYSDNSLCIQLGVNYDELQNYYLLINMRTFKCQIGEYLFQDACHQCDENNYQYSLLPNQQICRYVDFDIIEEYKYNQVKLKLGFWRNDILNQQFLFCENNPYACQGGWKAGNQQCAIRFIGPLCEECDQLNIMGNGYYYKHYDDECYECNYQSIIIIISTLGWIIILSIFVIRNVQNQNNQFQQYFLQYKQFEILYKLNQNQQNAVIKQFINIAQIHLMIILIEGWKKSNPTNQFFLFISNPISFNKFHLQCLFQIYDPRYLLIIYVFCPYFIILLVLACFCFVRRNIGTQSKTSINYSAIIFIFYLIQPNIVKELALFLSNRQILDKICVKGSLQYLYYSKSHKLWIKLFIAPQLFYFALTLPILLFYFLFKIRNDLIQKANRFKFNLLFNDFKSKFYFWEIYKIINREMVICLIIFYDNVKIYKQIQTLQLNSIQQI